MTSTDHTTKQQRIERWDTVFKALSAEPRRQLIVSLLDAPPDETVPLPESALSPMSDRNRDALQQELYHAHLPMLSDMEFIVRKSDPLVASRGPRFNDVARVVKTLPPEAISMPEAVEVSWQMEQPQDGGY